MTLPKIYVFVQEEYPGGEVLPVALAEDGELLASHFCSNMAFVHHDMGLTSPWKHEVYLRKYPEGFDLELVDGNPLEHEGCAAAMKKSLLKEKMENQDESGTVEQDTASARPGELHSAGEEPDGGDPRG